MGDSDDRFEIIGALDDYAVCLDERDWDGLGRVFRPDVRADYGLWQAEGLEALVERIRSMLGGCGPSQHLLGNYRVEIQGDRARSHCYARVMHFGRGEAEGRHYEVFMEYADEWTRTETGWRSHARTARASMERGDRSVLGPERSAAD